MHTPDRQRPPSTLSLNLVHRFQPGPASWRISSKVLSAELHDKFGFEI